MTINVTPTELQQIINALGGSSYDYPEDQYSPAQKQEAKYVSRENAKIQKLIDKLEAQR